VESFEGCIEPLIVSSESAEACGPGEGAFDHPATWQQDCHFQNYLGSSAHLVKMTEKSIRRRKLQNPPPELYVCDLIRRLKSATD